MVENSGTIIADGGEVYLTTNAVNELLKGVVNNTGIIEANSLDGITGNINLSGNIIVNNGEIKATGNIGGVINETANMIIDAGLTDVSAVNDAGTITQNSTEILQSKSATLKANSQNTKAGNISLISNTQEQNSGIYLSGTIEAKGQDGGDFATTAQKVTLNGVSLNTSGKNSAGNIKIGGDWQGTKVSLENAKKTNVVNSTITNNGKDGEIVVWSDEQTNFFSTIQAPNAKAEISSKGNLNINAENVKVKSLLLDPKDIEIKDEIGLDYYLLTNPNNTVGDSFGKEVVQLSNGNYVITASGTDVGGVSNVGRVYLYSEEGQLISTLSGTHDGDRVGQSLNSSSITLLTNGNYVISSSSWYDSRGAVTWGDANTGISGILDGSNSVVGSRASDRVGYTNGGGVIALTNGNYVIASNNWDNGTAVDAGAVTWVKGTTGKTNNNSGTISSSNSLVGSYSNDWVGNRIVALSNGNIATSTENWNSSKGAATWIDGTTGKTYNDLGIISSLNSIVGTNTDHVGRYLIALTNGGFVVGSPIISIDGISQAGAATWVNGTTGETSNNSNTISSANSIVGTTTGQFVGDGIYSISNGGYVVHAYNTSNNASSNRGALRWVDSTNSSDIIGNMSNSNSLYGLTGNMLGNRGVTELPNGKYVITSSSWANGSETYAGAVSLYSYKTGLLTISSSNSILGSKSYDLNGATITVLENGNYVVYAPQWKNSSGTAVGAYTFVSKDNGGIGEISSSNSLIGSDLNDFQFSKIITLDNGNYVIGAYLYGTDDKGAIIWGDGNSGVKGTVSSSNAFLGTSTNQSTGLALVELSNGYYAFSGYKWDNGSLTDTGAIFIQDGSQVLTNSNYDSNAVFYGTKAGGLIGQKLSTSYDKTRLIINDYNNDIGGTVYIKVTREIDTSLPNATFSYMPSDKSVVTPGSITTLLNAGTDVTLQANNDITVTKDVIASNTSGDGGDFTLQAGRHINVNANIFTENGNFTALAGDTNAISQYVSSGTPTITLASGKTIDVGTGIINLYSNGGNFVNNSTSNPFTASLTNIYLPSFTNATLGAITTYNKRYNTTFNGGCLTAGCTLPTSGINLLYSIAPKISVAPDSYTITYGDPFNGVDKYTLSGFVNGDDETSAGVNGTALFSNAATTSTSGYFVAGTHDLAYTSGLASSLGYIFEDKTSSATELTINSKILSVSDLEVSSKTYDGSNLASLSNNGSIVKVANDDLTFSTVATFNNKDVESSKTVNLDYTLNGNDAGNYTLVDEIGVATSALISKKELSIAGTTTNDKIYDGNTNAVVNLGTLSGFVGSETLTASALGTFASKDVGTQTATFEYTLVDGINGGVASNYSLANTNDDADISKRAVTLTADAISKAYGEINPFLTYKVINGYIANNDLLTGNLETTASQFSDIGKYDITSTLANSNYDITFIDATNKLTINKRAITINADSKSKVYGGSEVNLNATVSSITGLGLASSDSLNEVTGRLSRQAGENVGSYDVLLGNGSKANNYEITFNNDNNAYTITPDMSRLVTVAPPVAPVEVQVNNNPNIVSEPVIQETATKLVTLSEIRINRENTQSNNGPEVNEDIKIPLSKNSIIDLVNGGVKLPEGLEQLFFVVNNTPIN
jgi:hypothetical protein